MRPRHEPISHKTNIRMTSTASIALKSAAHMRDKRKDRSGAGWGSGASRLPVQRPVRFQSCRVGGWLRPTLPGAPRFKPFTTLRMHVSCQDKANKCQKNSFDKPLGLCCNRLISEAANHPYWGGYKSTGLRGLWDGFMRLVGKSFGLGQKPAPTGRSHLALALALPLPLPLRNRDLLATSGHLSARAVPVSQPFVPVMAVQDNAAKTQTDLLLRATVFPQKGAVYQPSTIFRPVYRKHNQQ